MLVANLSGRRGKWACRVQCGSSSLPFDEIYAVVPESNPRDWTLLPVIGRLVIPNVFVCLLFQRQRPDDKPRVFQGVIKDGTFMVTAAITPCPLHLKSSAFLRVRVVPR